MHSTLIIDNSNTNTKFALAVQGELTEQRKSLETSQISTSDLENLMRKWDFQHVILCSVVPRVAELVLNFFKKTHQIHNVSSESQLGIQINYPSPKQIGADRLANAEGGVNAYGAPCIIIDSGTAVTFDVISQNRAYEGGAIAPGLALMKDYFVERTALLPKLDFAPPENVIGTSTTEAMNVGAFYGYRGMIREILSQLICEFEEKPTIVATGGDAKMLFDGNELIDHYDADLTLKGILSIGMRNL